MNSKTAEDVACEAAMDCTEYRMNPVALACVKALRSAGFIHEPESQCVPMYEMKELDKQVSRLTRERDEARRMCEGGSRQLAALSIGFAEQASRIAQLERDLARKQMLVDTLTTQLKEARATTATPEMLRVVEAAKACKGRWARTPWEFDLTPESRALIAAVDALAASQRKAQEPPRYFTVNNEVYERTPTGSLCVTAHYGHGSVARAEAECARLNAEASK